MSIKTSLFKRVAQTAVVALLGGLMATVATPTAQANKDNGGGISASCVMRSGVGAVINVTPTKWGTGDVVVRAKGQSYTLSGATSYSQAAAFNGAGSTVVLSTTAATETQTSYVIPLTGDTAATTVSTLTYVVWADYAGNDASTPGAADPSTTVTCTDRGKPTKFVISGATTATAGDTVTYTVTPTDANGNATLIAPSTESFYASITPAAGRSNIHAQPATGANGVTVVPGAGFSDTVTTGVSTGVGKLGIGSDGAKNWHRIGNTPGASSVYAYNNATSSNLRARITVTNAMADAVKSFRAGLTAGNASVESATSTGVYTIRVNVESNTTSTFAVEGLGDLASSVTGSATLTTAVQVYGTSYGFGTAAATGVAGFGITKGTTGWNAGTPGITAPTAAAPTGSIDATAATTQTIKVSTGRTSIPLTVQLSTAGVFTYTTAAVTNQPLPTGITAATLTTVPATGVETQTTVTFTTTSPVAGQRFTVAWASAANTTHTVTFLYEAPSVGGSLGESVTLRDTASSKKVAVGGTMSNEVIVRDQFGSLVSGASVNWSVSGRNNKATATTTTGANGRAVLEWTDADSTKSVTTYPTDTLSVQVTAGNSGGYSTAVTTAYTFVASLAATSITVVNDGAAAGTAANGSITLTINVLDSAGAGLSGYPVTITSDSNSFVLTNGATTGYAYTNTAGQATATVYAKTAGTSTITVSSGGKTATSSYVIIAGSARTITLDAATASMAPGESKRVTATVKDSFGNVADGVAVTIAYTGTAGRVASVNGVTSSTCSTNTSGQCVIELASEVAGTGTLTVTMTGGDASTATLNDGTARPTRVLTGSTAVTISGSSTTVTAIGAAQAAADAAADAAAEAIDAANAATDAANLAAEAADAATVAAEEARDAADAATAAVEELATQVATLMAALKAQITTLANTVAKIAKKVKA